MAFFVATAALLIAGQTLTIAAMVGFISLGGIASRNGVLLLKYHIHLVLAAGELFNEILRSVVTVHVPDDMRMQPADTTGREGEFDKGGPNGLNRNNA